MFILRFLLCLILFIFQLKVYTNLLVSNFVDPCLLIPSCSRNVQAEPPTELLSATSDNVIIFHNTSNKESYFDFAIAITEQYRIARVVIDVFLVGIFCIVGFVGNALSLMVPRRNPDKNNTANWLLQALACVRHGKMDLKSEK